MNVPNEKIQEVSSILPVLKSPTIVPLVEEGWSSLHSVIEEKRFWEVIDQLKKAGAEGIVIIPIEKMISINIVQLNDCTIFECWNFSTLQINYEHNRIPTQKYIRQSYQKTCFRKK